MNSFGRIFKVSVFGESHGPIIGVNIDGVPSGLSILTEDFESDLKRRQGGNILGSTPRKETDFPQIVSGVFNKKSTGAPLTILFENKNVRSEEYEKMRDIPRPGHADFVAEKRYKGFQDYRGSGHFSARLTVGIVAAGVIAKKILSEKVSIKAEVIEVGGIKNVEEGLQRAIDAKDSVGAIVRCEINGVDIGLGEPFWDSLESLLAHAIFSIPAVKGIEFGSGFSAAKMLGSEHNDMIIDELGTTITNHAGGIVGGITNGNPITFQVAFKPTSSTPKLQKSFNWNSKMMEEFSIKGRHDLCVALRAPVIVEAMTAIVLADTYLIKKAMD